MATKCLKGPAAHSPRVLLHYLIIDQSIPTYGQIFITCQSMFNSTSAAQRSSTQRHRTEHDDPRAAGLREGHGGACEWNTSGSSIGTTCMPSRMKFSSDVSVSREISVWWDVINAGKACRTTGHRMTSLPIKRPFGGN